MRKRPTRPNNEVTQQYNSGVVEVFRTRDAAEPGYQPVEELIPMEKLRYEEQRLGINRLYLSRQNQMEIQRVIRVPRRPINTQDVAVTEDGRRYRIDTVQSVEGVYPPSLDLALVRINQGEEPEPEPEPEPKPEEGEKDDMV